MWKKDNKIFKNPLIFNDQKIFNPSDEELTAAGYTWEEPPVIDNSEKIAELNTAYSAFRSICAEIGTLLGVENFTGGFDEMTAFENNEAAATPEGIALSIKWIAADKLCTYLASKLGIGQPDWWYQCWEQKGE